MATDHLSDHGLATLRSLQNGSSYSEEREKIKKDGRDDDDDDSSSESFERISTPNYTSGSGSDDSSSGGGSSTVERMTSGSGPQVRQNTGGVPDTQNTSTPDGTANLDGEDVDSSSESFERISTPNYTSGSDDSSSDSDDSSSDEESDAEASTGRFSIKGLQSAWSGQFDDESGGGFGEGLGEFYGADEFQASETGQDLAAQYRETQGDSSLSADAKRLDIATRAGMDFLLDHPVNSFQDTTRGGLEVVTGADGKEEFATGLQSAATDFREWSSGLTDGTAAEVVTDPVAEGADALVGDTIKNIFEAGTGVDVDEGTAEGTTGVEEIADIGVTVGTAGTGKAAWKIGEDVLTKGDDVVTAVTKGWDDVATRVTGKNADVLDPFGDDAVATGTGLLSGLGSTPFLAGGALLGGAAVSLYDNENGGSGSDDSSGDGSGDGSDDGDGGPDNTTTEVRWSEPSKVDTVGRCVIYRQEASNADDVRYYVLAQLDSGQVVAVFMDGSTMDVTESTETDNIPTFSSERDARTAAGNFGDDGSDAREDAAEDDDDGNSPTDETEWGETSKVDDLSGGFVLVEQDGTNNATRWFVFRVVDDGATVEALTEGGSIDSHDGDALLDELPNFSAEKYARAAHDQWAGENGGDGDDADADDGGDGDESEWTKWAKLRQAGDWMIWARSTTDGSKAEFVLASTTESGEAVYLDARGDVVREAHTFSSASAVEDALAAYREAKANGDVEDDDSPTGTSPDAETVTEDTENGTNTGGTGGMGSLVSLAKQNPKVAAFGLVAVGYAASTRMDGN